MRAELRSELLKQRSTLTNLGLFAGMVGLVLFALVLHGFGLAVEHLDSRSDQLMTFGRGEFLGALFAALLGALSITSEIRHGTSGRRSWSPRSAAVSSPPRSWRACWSGPDSASRHQESPQGSGSPRSRRGGVDVRLDGSDLALLIVGGAGAAALWAAIGAGVGAVVRSQVPTVVGIAAWLLFVEGVLAGDALDLDVSRFAPGAAAEAISGQDPGTLLASWTGALVLVLHTGAAAAAGWAATTRRDVL